MTTTTNPQALIAEARKLDSRATPAPWGPYSANIPFYAIVEKPAPSMSKHDDTRPTYWRVEDAQFVAAARTIVPQLCDELEKALAEVERLAVERIGLRHDQQGAEVKAENLAKENTRLQAALERCKTQRDANADRLLGNKQALAVNTKMDNAELQTILEGTSNEENIQQAAKAVAGWPSWKTQNMKAVFSEPDIKVPEEALESLKKER